MLKPCPVVKTNMKEAAGGTVGILHLLRLRRSSSDSTLCSIYRRRGLRAELPVSLRDANRHQLNFSMTGGLAGAQWGSGSIPERGAR